MSRIIQPRRDLILPGRQGGYLGRRPGLVAVNKRFGSGSSGGASDPYAANVSLLMHFDGANGAQVFTDSSPVPKVVYPETTTPTTSTTQKQFGTTSVYCPATYLYVPNCDELNLGTGDWTIEFWCYATDQTVAYPTYICNATGWSTNAFGIRYDNTGALQKFGVWWNPSDPLFVSSSTYAYNTWRHIAVVRSGNTCTMYVDGVSAGSASVTGRTLNLARDGNMYIGWSNWDGAQGRLTDYIDELRITKGVARYTAAFTPPTTFFPDPSAAIASASATKIIASFDGADGATTFTDAKGNATLTSTGGIALSNAQSKWGTSALYNNGTTTKYVAVTPTTMSAVAAYAGSTFECWFRPASAAASNVIYDSRTTSGAFHGHILYMTTARKLSLYAREYTVFTSTNTLTLDTWYHVALVFSSVTATGATVKCYVDGVEFATGTITDIRGLGSTDRFWIGAAADASGALNGYISDFRLSAMARYTGTFTPPSGAFTS